MRRFSQQRQRARSLKMSALGKKSQAVQRERLQAAMTREMLLEITANPAPRPGDVIGSIEWRNFQTGKVSRWAVLRGTRRNNYRLRTPDGRQSRSHGLAWLLEKLRPKLLRA